MATLLAEPGASLFVCLGKAVVGQTVARIMGATLERSCLVDWGSQTADRYVSPDGIVVLAVAHLGRFKLMGRPGSERATLQDAKPAMPPG